MVVAMSIPISFRISIQAISTKAIQASLLSFKILIKLSNLTRIQVNQAGLHVRFVAKVAIQPLIVTIEWISHIKGGIH